MKTQLYLPPDDFYTEDMVGTKKAAQIEKAMGVALQQYRGLWRPASEDKRRLGQTTLLMIVDGQNDFMDDGCLPIPGAYADVRRLISLLYREGDKLTTIALSGDQHPPLAIYFPIWWVAGKDFTDSVTGHNYRQGEHPLPYTEITQDAIDDERWRALIDVAWSHDYPRKLAATGKKPLMVWPRHCEANTHGANIVPSLYEAVMVHSFSRFANPFFIWKGDKAKSEHYSPLELEVEIPGFTSLNTRFLKLMMGHDRTLVAGWASSHCELAFMETLVRYFAVTDPEVLKRVVFLEDCTSPVQHPTINFRKLAEDRVAEMHRDYGIQIAKSTEIAL